MKEMKHSKESWKLGAIGEADFCISMGMWFVRIIHADGGFFCVMAYTQEEAEANAAHIVAQQSQLTDLREKVEHFESAYHASKRVLEDFRECLRAESEKLRVAEEALGLMRGFVSMLQESLKNCPVCKELVVFPRDSKPYCEECGWPDDIREEACPTCGERENSICSDGFHVKTPTSNPIAERAVKWMKVSGHKLCGVYSQCQAGVRTCDPNCLGGQVLAILSQLQEKTDKEGKI